MQHAPKSNACEHLIVLAAELECLRNAANEEFERRSQTAINAPMLLQQLLEMISFFSDSFLRANTLMESVHSESPVIWPKLPEMLFALIEFNTFLQITNEERITFDTALAGENLSALDEEAYYFGLFLRANFFTTQGYDRCREAAAALMTDIVGVSAEREEARHV